MQRGDDTWRLAHEHAQDILGRYGDAWTRCHRDDLVQETTIAAWRWAGAVRDPTRFGAAVRTIARRVRKRALGRVSRDRRLQHELALRGEPVEVQERGIEGCYSIAGRRVPAEGVLPYVRRAVARLRPTDRQLLFDFHAGFCCAELSARAGRSETCVKTRLHRARHRIKIEVEDCVRAADGFDA